MKCLNRRSLLTLAATLTLLCGLPNRSLAVDVLKELSRGEAGYPR